VRGIASCRLICPVNALFRKTCTQHCEFSRKFIRLEEMNGLSGSVFTMPLRDLFLYVGSRQLSGMLQCEDGDDRKTVTIASGVAVLAASNHAHERFSHILVERGYLKQERLDSAMEQSHGYRLGHALVRQGLLEENLVREALVHKIENTLTALMDWSSGAFQFIEAEAAEEPSGVEAMVDLLEFWKAHGAELTPEVLTESWDGGESLDAKSETRDVQSQGGQGDKVKEAEGANFAPHFRREVKSRLAARGRGKRFPKDLQARAVEYYWTRVRQGSFLSEVARELGLPPPTLRRWVLDAPPSSRGESPDQWRAARIEGGGQGAGAPVLVGPNGMRVEGLDVETLATLLRRLDMPE
jgi:transposase-like protein